MGRKTKGGSAAAAAGGAFSFDDDEDDEETDTFERTPSPTPREVRASLFGAAAAGGAASSAAAAIAAQSSSAKSAASSSSSSLSAATTASSNSSSKRSSNGLGPSVSYDFDPATEFSSLPKLSVGGSAASSSSSLPSSSSSHQLVAARAAAASELELQQDELLEDMSHAVGRLAAMGQDIHTELAVQNAMLDELGEEMDLGANKMEVLQKKMDKFIRKSSQSRENRGEGGGRGERGGSKIGGGRKQI
jgi:hypothetical protein